MAEKELNSISIRRPKRRLGGCAGFTLLEVLVAFTILSLALTALVQAFASGIGGIGVTEGYTTAVMHARSLIDRVGTELPLVVGESSGYLDDRYAWTLRIAPSDLAGGEQAWSYSVVPYDVEVIVSWDAARSVTLTTLKLAAR
jgi:general secretion pathway protein I